MRELLQVDAGQRQALDQNIWALADDAGARIETALNTALRDADQPVRQKWLVAELAEQIVGLTHSVLVPAPPIYAGNLGSPGLLMEDCCCADDAPCGVIDALIAAAEQDLRDAGARILLAQSIARGPWRERYDKAKYRALTLYLSKHGFEDAEAECGVRPAVEGDVAGIVAQSARHRDTLEELDPFWTRHSKANLRFDRWMRRSLTFTDRDMLVSVKTGGVEGYVIAQPASALHFPPAHATDAVGVIDDYFHLDFSEPLVLDNEGAGARALLLEAEAAFQRRGVQTAMVVCPAAWESKMSLLEIAGYATVTEWLIKR